MSRRVYRRVCPALFRARFPVLHQVEYQQVNQVVSLQLYQVVALRSVPHRYLLLCRVVAPVEVRPASPLLHRPQTLLIIRLAFLRAFPVRIQLVNHRRPLLPTLREILQLFLRRRLLMCLVVRLRLAQQLFRRANRVINPAGCHLVPRQEVRALFRLATPLACPARHLQHARVVSLLLTQLHCQVARLLLSPVDCPPESQLVFLRRHRQLFPLRGRPGTQRTLHLMSQRFLRRHLLLDNLLLFQMDSLPARPPLCLAVALVRYQRSSPAANRARFLQQHPVLSRLSSHHPCRLCSLLVCQVAFQVASPQSALPLSHQVNHLVLRHRVFPRLYRVIFRRRILRPIHLAYRQSSRLVNRVVFQAPCQAQYHRRAQAASLLETLLVLLLRLLLECLRVHLPWSLVGSLLVGLRQTQLPNLLGNHHEFQVENLRCFQQHFRQALRQIYLVESPRPSQL